MKAHEEGPGPQYEHAIGRLPVRAAEHSIRSQGAKTLDARRTHKERIRKDLEAAEKAALGCIGVG